MKILRIIHISISVMEVALELSDLLVMQSKHTMSHIFHKIFATGRLVAKTLIKYNNNNLEENDEEVKEPINIELTVQKTDPYNDENEIDFKWLGVQEDGEDIALANFIESFHKQTDEENFPEK